MKNVLLFIISFISFLGGAFSAHAQGPCDADHTVLLTKYAFTPSSLVISPGESVAFINVEGVHNVNGDTSAITGEPFKNPMNFSLDETTGTTDGVCMGVITFDIPGTYQYDCSIGFHAKLGMVGTIEVDAFTLADLMKNQALPKAGLSSIAFNFYLESVLDSIIPYTVFVPNEEAVSEVLDLMQLNQFDGLSFKDMSAALEYHVVEGIFLAEDLEAGQRLKTLYGQFLEISNSGNNLMVDDARITSTNFLADNGVVHIIDKTLAPKGLPEASVWDVVEKSENHTYFEEALIQTGFKKSLRQQANLDPNGGHPGPFTIFAPTDRAIQAFAQQQGMSWPELLNSSIIDDLVSQHVAESRNLSSNIEDGQPISNYNNQDLIMSVTPQGLSVGDIELVVTDLLAYNGVVHVIDAVIPIDIPSPKGTCGTWKLNMYDSEGDGWEETSLYIEIDDVLIAEQTMPVGAFASFEFGVDKGSTVNLFYVSRGRGYYQSYELFDHNNDRIAESGQTSSATNSIGLLACAPVPDCGMMRVEMKDALGQGWGLGSLDIFKNGNFYLSIPFYYGEIQSTSIPVNKGDVFDFEYLEGSMDAIYNSFTIYHPDGSIIIDESSESQVPSSYNDIVPCTQEQKLVKKIEIPGLRIYPNPAQGQLSIDSDVEIQQIKIYDIIGNIVCSHRHDNSTIDISLLQAGAFVIEVQTSSGSEFRKVLIANE